MLKVTNMSIITMIRIMVSRSHQGDVMKMAEKFKPPGVVTPAGGAGYKVSNIATLLRQSRLVFLN